jgi:hypothetical protein
VRPQNVLPSLGQPTALHLRYAEELRDSFPDEVTSAARNPTGAAGLIYALLLSPDEAVRHEQLTGLQQQTSAPVFEQVAALAPKVAATAARARLPLIELALPALRMQRADEFARFLGTLNWLIESDRQIDLFEYVLQKVVTRHLTPHFSKVRPPVVQFYSLKPLLPDSAVLLSALAHVGQSDPAQIERAFDKGAPYLRAADGELSLLPREQCGLVEVDAALNRLAQAVPQIKKNVLEACVHVVGADGVIQEHEAELLRAMADTLDCPMPPFLEAE